MKSYRLPLREQHLFDDPNQTADFLNNEGRLIRSANFNWYLDGFEQLEEDPPQWGKSYFDDEKDAE